MYKTEPFCCIPESNTKIEVYFNEREKKMKKGKKKRKKTFLMDFKMIVSVLLLFFFKASLSDLTA